MTEKQILSESGGVRVWCPGRPRTKGSLKPTHVRLGGRCKVGLREGGEYSVPWKNKMIKAIREQCAVAAWPGPVEVHAFFRFEREGEVGMVDDTEAPRPWDFWPIGRQYGDEDKLRRNLLDALTQSGLLADDSQVVGGQTWKRFVRPGEDAGVEFVVVAGRTPDQMHLAEQVTLGLWRERGPVRG